VSRGVLKATLITLCFILADDLQIDILVAKICCSSAYLH